MAEPTSTILVIDDNEAERYYVARVLRKAGFEVQEGATGQEALRLAQQHPDLITLDVRLPDLNGFEVCRRLKSDVATRDIPILHVSASFTTPEAKAEGLEGGADGYLTHPVDPTELLATVRSLLRTHRAEKRVRAAAREWIATFDLIEDAVCLTDGTGEIARCNRAFAQWIGHPYQEIVGRRLDAVVPELGPVVASGATGAAEVEIGGRTFRVSSGAGPAQVSAGETRAWIFGDVSERRRDEESLRRSEEEAQARLAEIETIYDAAPIGLCVLDRELRFVRINDQMAAMNGRSVDQHLGRTVREILPQLADQVESKLCTVLSTGHRLTGVEIRGETPAMPGVERVWIQHWYPLRAPDGSVTGVNIAAEEVTQQRRAQEQLQQAQRLESVGRLAGGVAHETNNQMTVVLGCANFVIRHPALPGEVRADIEQIRLAAERTAAITAQLLAFGRRQYSRPEVIDLSDAVRRLQPILERALGSLSTLNLELAPGPGLVKVDPGQLDQVLLNLVMNSRDAMGTGGAVTIRTAPVRVSGPMSERFVAEEITPGDYVRMTVEDTGAGMDEKTLRRAFEPFFTTKGVGRGTGLGLSMVFGIVRQSGGYISVGSQPGKGSTFHLYFPVTTETTGDADRQSGEVPAVRGRSVLLVEDDAGVRAVLARELEARGYRVLEAEHGIAAMAVIDRLNGELDAVVTDIQMPELGGRELASRISRMRPGTPVIFMSGHPEDESAPELTSRGVSLIQKPFSGEELANLIERMLAAG